MRYNLLQLLSVLLLGASVAATADDNAKTTDTSGWICQYCEFEQGLSNTLELGIGHIKQDSFKFGEYSGLHEQGTFLVNSFDSRYRNYRNADYWDINAVDLGLDTKSVELQGGKQGQYNVSFYYRELPHYTSDTTRTPFLGSGRNSLTLPSGWVKGSTTGGMTSLDSVLSDVDLKTVRTQVGVGTKYIPMPKWETIINYRHETREGKKRIAGSFYFQSAELVQPVDYTTDLIEIAATYTEKIWQAKLAYHGSTFRNRNDSLIWHNPYSPIVAGAEEGELALPPDNEHHQVQASIATRVSETSSIIADLAFGRLTQNEDFLAATRNSSVTVSPLAAASLQGRVDTINANVKWNSILNEKLTLNATYRYSDRDNKSPQHTYEWVTTDANVATPRTNLPYGYSGNTVKLNAEYKFMSTMKTLAGYDYKQYKRTYQEVEQSRENNIWASLIGHAMQNGDFIVKMAHSDREKDGYQVIAGIDSPQNPLLRKYNMADRVRNTLGMSMNVETNDTSALGISVDIAKDEYPDSSIGLTSSKESSIGVDFSTQVEMHTIANYFFRYETISSGISGSRLYSLPNWSGEVNDRFNSGGFSFNHILFKNRLNIGIDYVHTQSLGRISITEGGIRSPLPNLATKLNSIKIYGNYNLSKAMVLNGTYWHESYTSSDWAFDNVNEDTIANNLSLGRESPSYHANVVMFSARYSF